MDPIIKIENLSKQYRLGVVGTGTLSNDLKRWWYRLKGKEDPFLKVGEINDRSTKGDSNFVWALKDINLEVMPGEVLGIIGKNGAGKSTLLKILSKVTGPTTGKINFNGRIGSLLEVGTGFHPELTGHENIFLNGAILGMTKAEIRGKLDEIVDFSGVERYIDTPVKRYSSGMMVRLGFAVAAHLEPEILVVDEVLAVGDAEFQKKAIGKMKDVSSKEGRTVLFVSHNMAAVQRLCTKTAIIDNGTIIDYGETREVINTYLQQIKLDLKTGVYIGGTHSEKPHYKKIEIINSNKKKTSNLLFGEPFSIHLTIESLKDFQHIEPLIAINAMDDTRVMTAISSDWDISYKIDKRNSLKIIVDFQEILMPGNYKLTFDLRSGRYVSYHLIHDALSLNISDQVYQNVKPNENVIGFLRSKAKWNQLDNDK